MRFKILLLLVLFSFSFFSKETNAEVYYAQDEAMKIAFPGSDNIEKKTFILTGAERKSIEKKARSKITSSLVTIFTGMKQGKVLGYATIDSRLVRTATATFMCVFTPSGQVKKTIILAFNEPPDYLLSEKWLEQFQGKDLSSPLRLGEDIFGVVGSTLSVNAISKGIRTAIAFYDILITKK